uniref:Uncharacterized protein n=1 Tax=Chromera velia CCMP2878 TaxID=1169474 RepID=A0A0G4HG34_9ALVE|eukprot:Cvel_27122.t1-p1 / transcript=Cvel_27122.t1 / gene=Cvel_27122 / organism=Chromera_velia_CCMP2878 / gene_product=hypothetical protein / transcript_product=hypothetical protein / location=Cvel_scaffold3329:2597-6416(-) / protein_length=478 / sequence_SO=supercontig / SO=protein_coding / is_pseudo=false
MGVDGGALGGSRGWGSLLSSLKKGKGKVPDDPLKEVNLKQTPAAGEGLKEAKQEGGVTTEASSQEKYAALSTGLEEFDKKNKDKLQAGDVDEICWGTSRRSRSGSRNWSLHSVPEFDNLGEFERLWGWTGFPKHPEGIDSTDWFVRCVEKRLDAQEEQLKLRRRLIDLLIKRSFKGEVQELLQPLLDDYALSLTKFYKGLADNLMVDLAGREKRRISSGEGKVIELLLSPDDLTKLLRPALPLHPPPVGLLTDSEGRCSAPHGIQMHYQLPRGFSLKTSHPTEARAAAQGTGPGGKVAPFQGEGTEADGKREKDWGAAAISSGQRKESKDEGGQDGPGRASTAGTGGGEALGWLFDDPALHFHASSLFGAVRSVYARTEGPQLLLGRDLQSKNEGDDQSSGGTRTGSCTSNSVSGKEDHKNGNEKNEGGEAYDDTEAESNFAGPACKVPSISASVLISRAKQRSAGVRVPSAVSSLPH